MRYPIKPIVLTIEMFFVTLILVMVVAGNPHQLQHARPWLPSKALGAVKKTYGTACATNTNTQPPLTFGVDDH